MRYTYYGAHVRIEHQGPALSRTMVVQRSNPLTGGWLDVAQFSEPAPYAHSDSKRCASELASEIGLGVTL